MMMRQEDFRKLFEEENDPLRANALSYDFAGEPMFTHYSFSSVARDNIIWYILFDIVKWIIEITILYNL